VATTAENTFIWGTGRRKSSIARVRLRAGTGTILINGRELNDYFPRPAWSGAVLSPLNTLNRREGFDVFATVQGGGLTGQSGAVAMGIARALAKLDREGNYKPLRDAGLMTRDSRMKERKKYGQRGARRAFQFSKR
jgi:small subunit ribosomal protein S9